jgi:hypothetical protein
LKTEIPSESETALKADRTLKTVSNNNPGRIGVLTSLPGEYAVQLTINHASIWIPNPDRQTIGVRGTDVQGQLISL